MLVYWAPTVPGDRAQLPEDATLLGALGDAGPRNFDLPLRDTPGHLLLYSLGHRTVVASTPTGSVKRLDRTR